MNPTLLIPFLGGEDRVVPGLLVLRGLLRAELEAARSQRAAGSRKQLRQEIRGLVQNVLRRTQNDVRRTERHSEFEIHQKKDRRGSYKFTILLGVFWLILLLHADI